jgi:hypothetical protein
MEAEIWRAAPGFDGFYEVSTYGQIRSVHRRVRARDGIRDVWPIIRRQGISTAGYPQVHLSAGGKDKVVCVHRLVALAFLPPVEGKDQVNHIDGNKCNNHVSNLEFCDTSENVLHAFKLGLNHMPCGSLNHRAKLTEPQVSEIKRRLAAGEGQTAISRDYGVTNKLIHLIAKGRIWGHVDAPTTTS